MQIKRFALAAFLIIPLAGCLSNDVERAAAGAVAGAVISDVTGGSALTGALIGGTAGALCDDVNLC